MKNITESGVTRRLNGGGAVTSFIIGFVLKKLVVEGYNYLYNKHQP